MPPTPRPIPSFIADASTEGHPYGRFADRLAEPFIAACRALEDLPEGVGGPEKVFFFPERGWGGRIYVPATAPGPDGEAIEFFGHVSYVRDEGGEPTDMKAVADFTDVTAEQNPDWQIDLNEDVIGNWDWQSGMGGDVTLVWGRPLVPRAYAATAELDGEVVDQAPVEEGRFSLVALDALSGFGDDVFLEVRLWDKRHKELARESLYEEPEAEEPTPEPAE